jgi:hypothetical protein
MKAATLPVLSPGIPASPANSMNSELADSILDDSSRDSCKALFQQPVSASVPPAAAAAGGGGGGVGGAGVAASGQEGTKEGVSAGGGTGSTRPIIGSQYQPEAELRMAISFKTWSFHFNILLPVIFPLPGARKSVEKWVAQTLRDRLDSNFVQNNSIIQVRFSLADFIPGNRFCMHGCNRAQTRMCCAHGSALSSWGAHGSRTLGETLSSMQPTKCGFLLTLLLQ